MIEFLKPSRFLTQVTQLEWFSKNFWPILEPGLWFSPGFWRMSIAKRRVVPTKFLDIDRDFCEFTNGVWWLLRAQGMFLKRYLRRKNGKVHTYWALVESVRTPIESWLWVVSNPFWRIESPWAKGGQGLTKPRKKGNVVPTFAGCFEYSPGKTGVPWSELRNLG